MNEFNFKKENKISKKLKKSQKKRNHANLLNLFFKLVVECRPLAFNSLAAPGDAFELSVKLFLGLLGSDGRGDFGSELFSSLAGREESSEFSLSLLLLKKESEFFSEIF